MMLSNSIPSGSQAQIKQAGAVGFTIIERGPSSIQNAVEQAQNKCVSHFPHLEVTAFEIGSAKVYLWGHSGNQNWTHKLPDGSILILIGSPLTSTTWYTSIEDEILSTGIQNIELPWDGRVVLIHISPDGEEWSFINDWVGSIPVFYTDIASGRIASSLEPAVVNAAQFSTEDFSIPAMVYLMIHGSYTGNWTLYRNMHVLPADSRSTWERDRLISTQLNTVHATTEHWETGWDDLVDEMHVLLTSAIKDTLKTQPEWLLPLSSGLDSRLIAAVAAEAGVQAFTYTWGPPTTRDIYYAHQVADALGLSWKRIGLEDDYLAKYSPLWADLFGSAMHFHGMYQMPFLNALKGEPPAPIISGFIGECLAGYDVVFNTRLHSKNTVLYQSLPDAYLHWQVTELESLLKIPITDALDEIRAEISHQKNSLDGPLYQKLRLFIIWGRQRFFTYFQSMLSSYWYGVATPYINRKYARFCLSLPRAALDDRRLQLDMMARYFGKIASIAGTYARDPALLSGSYLIKRRLAKTLPPGLTRLLLPEFSATRQLQTDVLSLQNDGYAAIWPIRESWNQLGEIFHYQPIEDAYQSAVSGDLNSVRKLQSIQTIAYRMKGA